jgi:hypothetical protein
MRRLLCVWMLILCVTCAQAKSHHGFRKSSMPTTVISPSHDSLLRQNQAIDQMGLVRIQNEDELAEMIGSGKLAALPVNDAVKIAPSLPDNRRYALPLTISFLLSLSGAYRAEFGKPLMVDSAVRPRSVQERLRRTNYAAAPADGETASSHEAGTTFDISKRMNKAQLRWMRNMLSYYTATCVTIVEEERACFHIQVIGETE